MFVVVGATGHVGSAVAETLLTLCIESRDPRTPLAAKIGAGAVAAYALSPIDLIPDLVPVLDCGSVVRATAA